MLQDRRFLTDPWICFECKAEQKRPRYNRQQVTCSPDCARARKVRRQKARRAGEPAEAGEGRVEVSTVQPVITDPFLLSLQSAHELFTPR